MDPNAMTAAGLEALQSELTQLETVERERIAQQIKTAREWGDLKENAEYHAAKEAQAHLETRILKLRERVLHANVVDASERGEGVSFGSTVELEDESGKRVTYTLVAAHEAAPAEGKLSVESPVGAALSGLGQGDTAKVPTPRGERRLRVVSIR